MKPCAHFEQAGDTAFNADPSLSRFGDAAQYLQQGALAGAVPTNDANDIALFYLKGNVFECPELLSSRSANIRVARLRMEELLRPAPGRTKGIFEAVPQGIPSVALVTDEVSLGQVFDGYDGVGHPRDMRLEMRDGRLQPRLEERQEG
jgi:hypothetical protein